MSVARSAVSAAAAGLARAASLAPDWRNLFAGALAQEAEERRFFLWIPGAAMGGVAVFASQMSGHPWQIDLHMYFFATLACLVAYCDWRPIIAGTLAVALHHLILNFIVPAAIFPGQRAMKGTRRLPSIAVWYVPRHGPAVPR